MGLVDETSSLIATIERVAEATRPVTVEFIVVIAPFASSASQGTAESLATIHDNVRLIEQATPGVGGAYRDGISQADGGIVILMSSDLETDPAAAGRLLKPLLANPGIDIVCASRWAPGGAIHRYHTGLKTLNRVFQWIAGHVILSTDMTDLTFAYRAYRSEWLNQPWRQERHGFFLESLTLPLLSGARAIEVPVVWEPRIEGTRHIKARDYLDYFRVLGHALTTRMRRKRPSRPQR